MPGKISDKDFETEICYLKDPMRIVSDEVVGDDNYKKPRRMYVKDMRSNVQDYDLDTQGFQVVHLPLKERNDKDLEEVQTKYFKEIEELLKEKIGVKHVFCFAPVLRPLDLAKPIPNTQKTIPRPHLDFGPNSAKTWWEYFTDPVLQKAVPEFLKSINADLSNPVEAPRFSILGVWRPLYRAVERDPMCFSDFRSIPSEDFVILQPNKRKTYDGEWSVMKHGDEGVEHKWYYLSEQRPDEVILFKHYDSAQDGVAWRCGHGAFELPQTTHLPDRESLEIRAFCIY